MGMLVKGRWHDEWYDIKSSGGEFIRPDAQFRHWVTSDGLSGPTGDGGFLAESGRYHLFVSLACPWAHRTLIFRVLKQLESCIGYTVVDPIMLDKGWEFSEVSKNSPEEGLDYLFQLYTLVDAEYSGRVTVPVLWDKQQRTIVNNESSEIIRMLNSSFPSSRDTWDYYPALLRKIIDRVNQRVYHTINNGVYRAGFATEQSAYEKAFDELFGTMSWLEELLSQQRYLAGDQITEADWRLFTTLIRFDAVYYGHFKTNLKRIEDYHYLSNYLRDLYQQPGIAETVNFDHIKRHYFSSHTMINPTQIVPKGPELDFMRPHDREDY